MDEQQKNPHFVAEGLYAGIRGGVLHIQQDDPLNGKQKTDLFLTFEDFDALAAWVERNKSNKTVEVD